MATLATLADQTRDLLYGLGATEHPKEDIGTLTDGSDVTIASLGRSDLWKIGDYGEFASNGEIILFTSDASAGGANVRRAQFGTTAAGQTNGVLRKNPLYPRFLIERMVQQVVRSMWPMVWTWHKDSFTFVDADTTYELDQYVEDVVEVYQYDLNNDERYHQIHPDHWRVVRQVATAVASTGTLLRVVRVVDPDATVYYTAKRRPHPDDLSNLSNELADLVPWMAAAQMVYARGQSESYSPAHQVSPRDGDTAQRRAQAWEGFYLRRLQDRRDQLMLEVPKPKQWSPRRVRPSW